MISARLRFMKTSISIAFVALTFFRVSISASPPDPIIVIPPVLDEAAQKKMTSAGRLRKGPSDVSKVSRVGLAKLTPNDPNRHIHSFPKPVAVKSEGKSVLEKNADGLLLKAESEYAKKEAGLSVFLTS